MPGTSKISGNTRRLILSSFVLLLLSGLSVIFKMPVWSSLIFILLIDIYMLFLLFMAAGISDGFFNEGNDSLLNLFLKLVPTRLTGLILFFIFLSSVILFFANNYLVLGDGFNNKIQNPFDAIYFSFITLTTLGFDNISPEWQNVKALVMFEILTAINLFLGSFALLVSRLSNF